MIITNNKFLELEKMVTCTYRLLVHHRTRGLFLYPFNSQDLIVNLPLLLLHISLLISYKNLVLDQDNNFGLIKFGYSHYLFAGQCIDVIGRSYMLITSRG